MLKEIDNKIRKKEKQKEVHVLKQQAIQANINKIDIDIKKLQNLKKSYEKLENNATELLKQI